MNSQALLAEIKIAGSFFFFFLRKLNKVLPYDPEIALMGIHPTELKTYVHTLMFIAVFFITAYN